MSLGNALRALIPQRVHDDLFRLSSTKVSDRYASDFQFGGALRNLRRCGFRPVSVIDVGAFIGDWTQHVRTIWPEAKYLMIEPQPNTQGWLRAICDRSVS
jgi:hypothetical protein